MAQYNLFDVRALIRETKLLRVICIQVISTGVGT